MAVDPRSQLQENCAGSSAGGSRAARQALYQQKLQASFPNVNLNGGINPQISAANLSSASTEQLNSIGGIQAGIEGLVRLSNEIRGTGRGGRRTTIGGIVGRVISENGAVDAGANAVLQGLGIGRNVTSVINGMIPANVDKAFATADRVFNLVKSGNLLPPDIQAALPDFLQVQADIVNAPKVYSEDLGKFEACFASPYATDLIAKAPKFKYLFVVEFEWASPYSDKMQFHAFVVKNTTRPNIRYDYEDINMYNFRTKAIKRMEYEPMTMRFLDDQQNTSMKFVNQYYKAMSPIGNLPVGPDKTSVAIHGSNVNMSSKIQEEGMDFNTNFSNVQEYSSSIGPLKSSLTGDDVREPLKRITVYHVFDYGKRMNVYTMYNPKITELQMDELDHSIGTEGAEVSLTFVYDALTMVTSASFNPNSPDGYNIKEQQVAQGAKFPLRFINHPGADKQEGLIDGLTNPNGIDNSFPASESFGGVIGAGTGALTQFSGQTLERAARALPLPLPGLATSTNFLAEQALSRVNQSFVQLNEEVANGAGEFQIDGDMLSITRATQILKGKQAKYAQLLAQGRMSILDVERIDSATGIV